MNPTSENSVEIQLSGWAYGGEAFGRAPDGRMVFAPFCIPGEIVRGAVKEQHDRWARLSPLEWLQSSPDRIEARCLHFGECGGCSYQHLSYDQQLHIKSEIVAEQLQRIGALENPPVFPTIPSPRPWEYRNHMRYHVLDDGSLGLMRYKQSDPFAIKVCHLPESELGDLWRRIDLPPKTTIDQVSIRMGTSGDPMVILHGDMQSIGDLEIDFPVSLIWQDGASWRVLAGESYHGFEILDQVFRVSPPSFFQTNTVILPELVKQVIAAMQLEPGMNVFDLYAGVGLFSAFAAKLGARVYAVEESNPACVDFEINLNEFNDVSLYEAPVELALPAIDLTADVVLVDPPRAGLSRVALDAILQRPPERLVYLSCDVGTLARDARRLTAGGYTLMSAMPIDIFPQTFHIETLTTWVR